MRHEIFSVNDAEAWYMPGKRAYFDSKIIGLHMHMHTCAIDSIPPQLGKHMPHVKLVENFVVPHKSFGGLRESFGAKPTPGQT